MGVILLTFVPELAGLLGFSNSELCYKSAIKSGQRAVKSFPDARREHLQFFFQPADEFWARLKQITEFENSNNKKPANSGTLVTRNPELKTPR